MIDLYARGFDPSPPKRTTKVQDNPTLLFSWWATGFAIAFIGVRLCGRMVRNNQLFKEDKIMFASMIPLLIRMGLVHVVMIWGTNNLDTSGGLSELEIQHREIGSKLVLAARIFYAMFIWMAKLTISEFLKRLTSTFWKRSYELTLRIIRITLLLTFIAVVIATLAECQPFDHYWQVIPDPGPKCRMGYAQLITMGTADMFTDALLIFFPVSLVALSPAFTIKRKLRLCALFSLSGVLMAVTGYRIKSVINHHGRQQYRTVYASGEILGAAAVANAIVIGSFLRDRGVKKQKYKYNSVTDSMERPSRRDTRSVLAVANDSDDDIFSGTCYRSVHDEENTFTPRPPPMATVSPGTRVDSSTGIKVPESYFPSSEAERERTRDSQESDSNTAVEQHPVVPEAVAIPSPRRARRVSFCDVGGLLEDASSQSSTLASSSPRSGTQAQDFANNFSFTRRVSETPGASPFARRGSRAILSELGGFLSPILQGQKRGSQETNSIRQGSHDSSTTPDISTASGALAPIREPPPTSTPVSSILLRRNAGDQSLQDVGGLLGSEVNTRERPDVGSPSSHTGGDDSFLDVGGLLSPPCNSLSIPSSPPSTRWSQSLHAHPAPTRTPSPNSTNFSRPRLPSPAISQEP